MLPSFGFSQERMSLNRTERRRCLAAKGTKTHGTVRGVRRRYDNLVRCRNAGFTASLLYRGDRVSETTGCASVTCAVIDDDTLSRFRHNVAPTSINQASEFRGCFSRPL